MYLVPPPLPSKNIFGYHVPNQQNINSNIEDRNKVIAVRRMFM